MGLGRVQAGYSRPFAPYPAVGYPLTNFAGAGNLSPRSGGVGAGANAMAGGTGGGNPTAVSQLLPSSVAKNTPLAIIIVVAAGYLIWHFASKV